MTSIPGSGKASDLPAEGQVFVAGHRGMVGSAIVRCLQSSGVRNLLTRSRAELDLRNQSAVNAFFSSHRISQVYLAAAHVGGIHANSTYPGQFIYDNLMVQANIIDAARRNGVERLLFLGSSCIYPKFADQPIAEEALLTGMLEPTNESYAIAKIAGIKLCESYNREYGCDYRSVMPTNLYGPGDNYHPQNSHVVPALIRRFHEAKVSGAPRVAIWGTGTPRREFLHVDDMAEASVYIMNLDSAAYGAMTTPTRSHINVGYGSDVTIAELATLVAATVGYEGEIDYDATKPDGTPRKLMESRRINGLGWFPHVVLSAGLKSAYQDFVLRREAASLARMSPATGSGHL